MVQRSKNTTLVFSAFTHYRRWLNALIPVVLPEADVSFQQLNVLYYVRTEDASMADIARILGIAPTVVTGLVDRLENNDLLRREPHRTDRRRIQLVLTEEGREISERMEAAVLSRIDQQVGRLAPDEQQQLLTGLALFEQLARDLETETSQGLNTD